MRHAVQKIASLAFAAVVAFSVSGDAAQAASSLAAQCAKAPVIKIVANQVPAQLTTQRPEAYAKKMRAGWRVQGLTVLKRQFAAQISWDVVSTSQGSCLRMREVTVRAGEIPPKIWINPSIRVNSCEYKITMRHELEHVKNHNTYLTQFKTGVKSNFPKMLGRNGYVMLNNGRSTAQAQAQIRNSVTQILHAINRKYDAIADKKDQHMDTPSNYRREFASCR